MRSVKSSGCTAKSSLIAVRIRSRFAIIIPASACSWPCRSARLGYGCARKALFCRSNDARRAAIAAVSPVSVSSSRDSSGMAVPPGWVA